MNCRWLMLGHSRMLRSWSLYLSVARRSERSSVVMGRPSRMRVLVSRRIGGRERSVCAEVWYSGVWGFVARVAACGGWGETERVGWRQTDQECVRSSWKWWEVEERARSSVGRRKGVMLRRRYSLESRSRRLNGCCCCVDMFAVEGVLARADGGEDVTVYKVVVVVV